MFKVQVYPSHGLFLPVLPMEVNGKLLFPLCHACAESCRALCIHSNKEGALLGTWYSLELNKALEKGYSVCEIYEF